MATTTGSKDTAKSVLSDVAASAAEGFRKATHDAAEAAERTAPAIKRSVSKGAYMLAYGLSFGVVYTAEVIVELMPEDGVLRQGFRDGAEAAREARAAHHAAVAEPAPKGS
jgi:hypothetical protein